MLCIRVCVQDKREPALSLGQQQLMLKLHLHTVLTYITKTQLSPCQSMLLHPHGTLQHPGMCLHGSMRTLNSLLRSAHTFKAQMDIV